MRASTIIPLAVTLGSGALIFTLFTSGASPYITIAEARKLSGDRLNLGVDVDRSTLRVDLHTKHTEFVGKDKNGESIKVRYTGAPIDFSSVTRANCIGKLEGDTFVSEQITVKCPSKYEETTAEKKADPIDQAGSAVKS